MFTFIRQQMRGFITGLVLCSGSLATGAVHAATVTIGGPADCWGLAGYPTVYNATNVQIYTSLESVRVSVNLLGFYSLTMKNVPLNGINAVAKVTCQSADTWN